MAAGVYGHEVVGDLPFTRLRNGELPRGRIKVARSTAPLLAEPAEILQLVEADDGDGIAFATARAGETLRCWCAATGEYLVDPRRGLILAQAANHPVLTEDRLLNALIPLLLLARGELVLHRSRGAHPGRRAHRVRTIRPRQVDLGRGARDARAAGAG